jgi:hypothetical protein
VLPGSGVGSPPIGPPTPEGLCQSINDCAGLPARCPRPWKTPANGNPSGNPPGWADRVESRQSRQSGWSGLGVARRGWLATGAGVPAPVRPRSGAGPARGPRPTPCPAGTPGAGEVGAEPAPSLPNPQSQEEVMRVWRVILVPGWFQLTRRHREARTDCLTALPRSDVVIAADRVSRLRT